ncbi:MAG: L-threonylcarbamoyladenylate synthase [Pseudomonadota bacterium]
MGLCNAAIPTETVYGLAADATNDDAVAQIFDAKGRPRFNPLIVHVRDIAMAEAYVSFSPLARALAEAFWPGPLTLVLPRRPDSAISLLASAGLDTLGLRAPRHPLAQAVIGAAGRPLAAPSANRSGAVSPTTANHVRESLGERVDVLVDGGASAVGLESTIIKVEDDAATILRPGGLSRSEIEAVAGAPLAAPRIDAGVEAPGMLASHYAPDVALRLSVTAPDDDEAYLGFGDHHRDGETSLNLSRAGSTREAAANLFSFLRQLDAVCAEHGLKAIAAAPVPEDDLGEAINDRLRRAAAPRSDMKTS